MKTKPYALSLLPLSILLITTSAQALTPEQQYQYQQQRSEALKQQQLPNPNVSIDTDAYQTNTPQQSTALTTQPDTNSPCFDIHHLYLTGELAEQFNFAVLPFTQGSRSIIGSCMSVTDINNLVTAVQNHIVDEGYITSRVLIQNQNLKTGNLYLTLIPGRVDQIIADDTQSSRPIYTDNTGNPANFAKAIPIKTGDLLNVRDIEQALENFKKVPTADADFSIAPSSRIGKPGYSDILIKYKQDRRFRVSATLDDSGQESTGEYQGSITLSLDNPTWHNDLLYLSYSRSLDDIGKKDSSDKDGDSWSYNLGYTLPIHYSQLTLTHSGYDYDQTVAGVNQDYTYSGESYTTDASISHLVHRDNHSKTYLTGGLFAKQQRNYIDDTEVEVQRRKTAGYKAGIGYETSIGQTQIISDLTYQRGTGAFNAMTPPESLFNEGSARTGIIKTNIDINHPFKIKAQALNYHANIKGQYAKEALVPNDRFSIGGRYTVRGFDGERSLSGDHGALIRQEISAYLGDKPHALYAGVDAGYVKMDNSAQDDLLLGHHLIGGVVGIKGYIKPAHINYDLFAGYPLKQPDGFSDKDWTTGFSLGWQY